MIKSTDNNILQIVAQFYRVRSLIKMETLNLWQSCLRILMLSNLLKLPLFRCSLIDSTVVTILGIATNIIAIAK